MKPEDFRNQSELILREKENPHEHLSNADLRIPPLWADGIFVDVSGQNFVDHLSIDAHGWVGEGLAVILGLMVYFFPIIMTENEHIQCYPLWLHCFYWAADFMGIWVFFHAWNVYDHFLLFLLLSIGEAVFIS